MNDSPESSLTPQGHARREAMLAELTGSMRRTHRARRLRRRAINTAVLSLGVLVLARWGLVETARLRESPRVADAPSPRLNPPARNAPNGANSCSIAWIESDPNIVARLAARPTSRVVVIDDLALVAVLAALDRPAGIIRTTDQVRLTADVTDEALNLFR
jgi:hypothetical protein